MKTLFVLRHAKSSWNEPDISDFDRPLNERGVAAAPFMGKLMAARQLSPDVILSSPANRARTTSELLKAAAGLEVPIKFDDRIYEASPQSLLGVIAEIEVLNASAMLVGHNPGIEGLIRILTGRIEPMPTAALAIIDLRIENWGQISPGCGDLREVIRPREETTDSEPKHLTRP